MAIFGPKPWVKPFGKMSIFKLFHLFFFIAEKRVFSFKNIVKDIFLAYMPNKKNWKIGHFGPKPWLNPFGKKSIFRPFSTSCFYSLKTRFFLLEYRKIHFPILYCLKKKVEKMAILNHNHGLTPLEKSQFFDFSNFFFQ